MAKPIRVVSMEQWRILVDQLRQFKGIRLIAVDSAAAITLGDRAKHILAQMGLTVEEHG